jgi:hypothetical protein
MTVVILDLARKDEITMGKGERTPHHESHLISLTLTARAQPAEPNKTQAHYGWMSQRG